MGDAVQILTVVGPLVVMLLLGAMAVRMAAKMCREVRVRLCPARARRQARV